MLAIFSHTAYDVVREALDRLLYERESALHRRLRALVRSVGDDDALNANLRSGLESVCRALNAGGGFLATRDESAFAVRATVNSLPVSHALPADEAQCDDVREPHGALARSVAWLAPVFNDREQIAVIGLGPKRSGSPYTPSDLDLLGETADWSGRLLTAHNQQMAQRIELQQMAEVAQRRADQMQAQTEHLVTGLSNQPEPDFVKQVEDALRHLSDYTALGASPLAEVLNLPGATHIDRGKTVREALITAIESLRPAPARPGGVLPREWHAFAILHDAYVEDVPNRDIMARLYISEGTFNRARRRALQAVARALREGS